MPKLLGLILIAFLLICSSAHAQVIGSPMRYCDGYTSWDITLTGSAQQLLSYSGLRNRVIVYNEGASRADLGFDNTVTVGTGIPMLAAGNGVVWGLPAPPPNQLWVIGTSGQSVFCAQN